jgi:hypothetical protein
MDIDDHHAEDHSASFTVGIIFIAVLMIITLIGLMN